MTDEQVRWYIEENELRKNALATPYDPIRGTGTDTCERRLLTCRGLLVERVFLPVQAFDDPVIRKLERYGSVAAVLKGCGLPYSPDNIEEVNRMYVRARIKYDFEFWCASCVTIKDKVTGSDIKFVLNRAQRKLLTVLLDKWTHNEPIQIILCKARQWGGSTLTQIFMAWIQIVHKKQWNSVIAAHKENTARIIRGMYTKILKNYPGWLVDSGNRYELSPFEGSQKTRYIRQRGCRITVGSAEQPDALAGEDIAMAHLSEVALWASSDGKKPEDLARAIIGSINTQPGTLIVYESTARGVGNFFHNEWIRANKDEGDRDKSAFTPLFVAWYEIDMYRKPLRDKRRFVQSLTEYERGLFEMGATLEGINWRRITLRRYSDESRFMSEYPSTADEAFQTTGRRFYNAADVKRLRQGCIPPKFTGDMAADASTGVESLNNIRFEDDVNGRMKVWSKPDDMKVRDRYCVVVDIGGGTERADNSVICVIDRYWMTQGGVPVIAAEWCGHIDHDLLAWKAAQVATWYDKALLIIESNTLEHEQTEGDHFEFILDEIAAYYDNLFCRTPADKVMEGVPPRWGFHTNKSSKQMVCDHMRKCLRENMYIESCKEAVDEFDYFEVKPNGSLGAIDGKHDDRHITRAIGIWACYQHMSPPRVVEKRTDGVSAASLTDFVGVSSF